MTTQDGLTVPEFGWADYFDQTTIHPRGVAALVVLCLLTIALPRRYSLVPGLVLACFIPNAQRIVVFGLDFTFLRIFILVGLARVLARGELQRVRWQRADTVIVAWAVVMTSAFILLRGTTASAVHIAGQMTESLGSYLLVRSVVRSWVDLRTFIVAVVAVSVVISIAFLTEKATGRNTFAIFGGVPEITVVRDGRLRCQGAFAHPILAGCFWAACVPYVASLWFSGSARLRLLAIVGTVCCLITIVTCASSTPVLSLAFGAAAAAWFPFRRYTGTLRIVVVLGLIGLHLVMKQPVWHLIGRIDIAGGSTGFHRFMLIDAAVNNFFEWALIGTESTADWGIGLIDVTNEYVWTGVRGGVLALILFLVLIGIAFRRVGLLCRAAGKNRAKLWMAWALGMALVVHCTSFIAVSYYGQIIVLWSFALAVPISLSEQLSARQTVQAPAVKSRRSSDPSSVRRRRDVPVQPRAAGLHDQCT